MNDLSELARSDLSRGEFSRTVRWVPKEQEPAPFRGVPPVEEGGRRREPRAPRRVERLLLQHLKSYAA